ncbi:BQ2448_3226 [Microbotryum intermedium]|uniref:BQ2448_3226 protein n=1 Tax=Microbotryum intermedium TaxID=269621 RepID=A0A238FKE5_9BASI|nr:BQ2448_3226 [Microbotryum intermedium]
MLCRPLALFSVSLLSLTHRVTALPAFGADHQLGAWELLASSQTGLHERDTSASSNVSVSTFAKESINSVPGIYVCALDCASLWTIYEKCDLSNSSAIDRCLCNLDDNNAWATCTLCIAAQQGNTAAQQNYTSAAQLCYTSGCGRP